MQQQQEEQHPATSNMFNEPVDNPVYTVEQIKKGLSFQDLNKIRANTTLIREAPSFELVENRSMRFRITTTDEQEAPVRVGIVDLMETFEIGSLQNHGKNIDGIMGGFGINTYKITFKTAANLTQFLNDYPYDEEHNAHGFDRSLLTFQFEADKFAGKVEQITIYPIPAEMSTQMLKEFLETKLDVGKIESIIWGRHKAKLTNARNGFAHVNVRHFNDNCERIFKINGRVTTLLLRGQQLTAPCFFCRGRNHLSDGCPTKKHFDYALDARLNSMNQPYQSSPREGDSAETVKDDSNIPASSLFSPNTSSVLPIADTLHENRFFSDSTDVRTASELTTMLTANKPNLVTQAISEKNTKLVLSAAEKRQHSPAEGPSKKEKKDKAPSPPTGGFISSISKIKSTKLSKSDKNKKKGS